MSGHSKWSQIKRKKEVKDVAKGKVFGKLIRELTVAAKRGGGDPNGNARLRLAIQSAKDHNMPQDNIMRAIKRGTGEGGTANYEETTYEGYGPGGVALMIDTLTDNKNRTTAEVRYALNKLGGNLGEHGCVAWVFETKGVIWVPKERCDEERLIEVALEAGAEDVSQDGDGFEVTTSVPDFEHVRQALVDAKIQYESASIQRVPKTLVKVEGEEARKVISLMEALEDLDDVQAVSANFDVPTELLHQS
jgi:YebC/PmpR family DNA-binding regulatory protein